MRPTPNCTNDRLRLAVPCGRTVGRGCALDTVTTACRRRSPKGCRRASLRVSKRQSARPSRSRSSPRSRVVRHGGRIERESACTPFPGSTWTRTHRAIPSGARAAGHEDPRREVSRRGVLLAYPEVEKPMRSRARYRKPVTSPPSMTVRTSGFQMLVYGVSNACWMNSSATPRSLRKFAATKSDWLKPLSGLHS